MNYALFRKPSRYIGSEVNMIRKEAGLRFALCFPDTYEIGMSHLGLKVLYSIINSNPAASAERVYAPWGDLEAHLRDSGRPLTSLENQRPLRDFDIVGFTLQYELSYTNVLNMMDLGGIPVKTAERGDEYPIIIAGGPCTVNPLPLVPFIDAFVIGDGEDVITEIIEKMTSIRTLGPESGNKPAVLNSLAEIEGIYVPSVHGTGKQRIRRRFVEDLDTAVFPDAPVLPYTSIVHDRVAIEISRGCTKGCRFCQAGMIYRPLRERSLENVLALAGNSIANTGYEEISFTSLSTGDYSSLLPLIREFNRRSSGSCTSVSLPSLRVGAINSAVLKEIKSVRKTGFTIAPEAGTNRLRTVINKDFTDEEYEETLEKLFTEGWNTIKLYFMIGLPTETMEDIDGLITMALKALKKGRQITGRRVTVNVGVSAFIPKPHTPFQWTGQNSIEELRKKQDYIRRAFRKRGINFKGQHVENSLLEAVFARADKESSLLLEKAWRLGCRFDGWTEHFDFGKWEQAAEQSGINLYEYASRSFGADDELPWDFIDTGITKKFLKAEYGRALKECITSDCRESCYGCGLECKDREQDTAQSLHSAKHPDHAGPAGIRGTQKTPQSKYRVRFSKTGILRYLSHQELMNSVVRAMRRGNVPIAYSTGFHPHPRISFGPALASGIEGLNEFFDIETTSFMNASDLMKCLNSQLPEGLEVHSAASIPLHAKSLNNRISRYEYEICIDKFAAEHIHLFMSRGEWIVERKRERVDIRPMVEKAEIDGEKLHLIVNDIEKAQVRLYELLKEMLQTSVERLYSTQIKRIGLYGYNKAEQLCL